MHVRYGWWCAKCVQQSQMFTIAEVHAMAKARDGVCLSERYTKGSEKLRWRCAKGHEWMTIPAKIKAGAWCPTCARHPHTIASMQTLDRYGNRLDKAATKEGGAFANATTTLPDMWLRGFNDLLFGFLPMNVLAGTPRHPLFAAPPRNYMLLAAQRLAMLVRIIRTRHPDDSVNVVAHSQGTMLTLLANAFLKDEGLRPIDSALLMNSPYSLIEPLLKRTQLHAAQQTRAARVDTLVGILHFIGNNPHTVPALADVADPGQFERCIGGLRWTGKQCTTTLNSSAVDFAERDNRGNVMLYFTPRRPT